uniref:phospholipase A2 n=1 Tax=Gallus gallus TaxID=9031 RepID=A0A8V0ZLU1_CHICK
MGISTRTPSCGNPSGFGCLHLRSARALGLCFPSGSRTRGRATGHTSAPHPPAQAALLAACARAWPGGAVCAHRVVAAGGARYAAFLSAGPGPPALVEGAWGGRGKLRGCWARRDPRVLRAFLAACARRPSAAPAPALRRDVAALWRRRAACAEPAPHRGSRRRRRGWTVPGTLWCGAGDSAGNSSELGLFRDPDRCCREHDRCGAQIAALQFNFGIRNYRPHTVSHCDCDAAFRRCLRALNDTISDLIGVTFFDLLEVPCFVLRRAEQCVRWHWWGGGTRWCRWPRWCGRAPTAPWPLRPSGALRAARSPEPSERRSGVRPSRRAPRADGGVSAGWGPGGASPGRALRSDHRSLPSGLGRLCRAYRHLDRCEHRIAPREAKYGLRNGGARTLFHCNCTRRCVPWGGPSVRPSSLSAGSKLPSAGCPQQCCAPGEGGQTSSLAAASLAPSTPRPTHLP